jgi:hypothetical protein
MYLALAAIFLVSLVLLVGLATLRLARAFTPWIWPRRWWSQHRRRALRFYGAWFGCYALFIAFGTGPEDLSAYPPSASSPYKLP